MASEARKLSKEDLVRWGWIWAAAIAGTTLDVIAIHVIPDLHEIDTGYNALVVMGLTLLVDLGRRWFTDTRIVSMENAKELVVKNGQRYSKLLPFILIPLMFAFGVVANAQELKVAEKVPAYQLVKAEAISKEAQHYIWDVFYFNRGNFVDVFSNPEGTSVIFTGPPGNYIVRVRMLAVKDAKIVSVGDVSKNVTIGDLQPVPIPGPVNPNPPLPDNPNPPLPNPDVVAPNEEYGLLAYNEALKVSSETRKAGAKILGDNFESVAAAVNAGGIKTVSELQKAIKEKNSLSLTKIKNATDWKSWFVKIDAKIQEDLRQMKLKTLDDLSEAFTNIANGLKYSAKE